jgi:hypothetical protein
MMSALPPKADIVLHLLCATFGHTRSFVPLDYVEPTHVNRFAPMSADVCFPNL